MDTTQGSNINPIFGPTQGGYYWSATTDVDFPNYAWAVSFGGGGTNGLFKNFTVPAVRAVRGGL